MPTHQYVNLLRTAIRNAKLSLLLLLLAACGGGGSSRNNVVLQAIAITPTNPSQQLGKTLQLIATGTYSDGTARDVSSTVAWSSSKTSVATVSAAGLLSTLTIGTSTITATLGGVAGRATMTVTRGPAIESILHTFGTAASDGLGPNGSLIQASDGNFYGTTSKGGAYGAGTVFKITPAGVETVLYSFGASPSDGANPVGSLIQASDGSFYGTTSQGGANSCDGLGAPYSCGTVFKITPAGVETVLYSFGASPSDGVFPLGSLIQASDGDFYGTTLRGGANSCWYLSPASCGTVFKITPAGVEMVLYSFGASVSDGVEPAGSLIQASDGNFYGTTTGGGGNYCRTIYNSCGTVFRITPAGVETVLHLFSESIPASDGSGPNDLIQASDGNFYGTTRWDGAVPYGNGTVFKITPAGVETILYSFGASASDGSQPVGSLIQASDGNFYGTTNQGGANANSCPIGCGTVFQITPAGAETILYSFGASASDGSEPVGSLIQTSDGGFYGATFRVGVLDSGTVFKLVP